MKSGWKTSEFWLSLFAACAPTLSNAGYMPPLDTTSTAALISSVAAYAISRGLAKLKK